MQASVPSVGNAGVRFRSVMAEAMTYHLYAAPGRGCSYLLFFICGAAQARVAGVHAASEALLIGNPLQKMRELPLLLFTKCGQQSLLVFTRDAADCLQGGASLLREVQSIAAPIIRIAAPLDEAAGFQIIHQRDQAAGDHLESVGQRLLGHGRSCVKDAQHPRVGWH